METSGNQENGSVLEREEKQTGCPSNLEDSAFGTETSGGNVIGKIENAEVDILEPIDSCDLWLADARCGDETVTSSSFGNTTSEVENSDAFSDDEVVSESHGDATSSLPFEGLCDVFRMRRKKLTSHWRTFIQPLMWRCKWVELQIKKFMTQAVKYDRELAEYNHTKESDSKNVVYEGIGAKSQPFSGKTRRERIMSRNKRMRLEDSLDLSTYMSCHNLFSYYESRPATNGGLMDTGLGNLLISNDSKTKGNDDFGGNDELLPLEIGDGDNSLERILWEIGCVQSRVDILKTRLSKVKSENAEMISSLDDLSLLVPCNVLSSSAQKAPTSKNENTVPTGSSYASYMPENGTGDLIMHEGAVSNHGEVTNLSDIIESTNQSKVVGSCKNTDGILTYNRRAKQEKKDYKEVPIQPTEKPQTQKEEQQCTIPAETVFEDLPIDDQTPLKIRSISKLTSPKNKRKRGRRKAGLGKWNRRSSV